MTHKLSMIALILATVPLTLAGAAAQPLLRTILRVPVHAACISSSFGPRVVPNQPEAGTYHYGVDLPAALGTGVFAAAAGTVIRTHQGGPGGLELLIQHDGFVGIYSHFETIMPDIAVPGRRVAGGEQLGFVGSTGVSTGPHLYFEMILGGRPVDPAPYLRLARCDGEVRAAVPYAAGDGGTAIDGRRYWQFGLEARQYFQWPQDATH